MATNAKAKATKKEDTFVQEDETFVENEQQYFEEEVKPAKKVVKELPIEEEFAYEDRLYVLKGNKKPLVYTVPSKHTQAKPLLYFDKDLRRQRELRYATNQSSPLVDEQQGTVTLGKIAFRAGILRVPKDQVALQKLLSLYHPFKDKVYEEYNAVQEAEDDVDMFELELEAMNLAKSMDVDILEAILRVEFGSKVANSTSKELRRDALVFARRNPGLFLSLATDEDVELRSIGARAVEQGIIKLSSDQRTFTFGDNGRKLMTVPFNEHPYSALAAYFKTDDGMEVYNHLTKRLK
jgi:hypothetical protein